MRPITGGGLPALALQMPEPTILDASDRARLTIGEMADHLVGGAAPALLDQSIADRCHDQNDTMDLESVTENFTKTAWF
jgi:hypothetical protein